MSGLGSNDKGDSWSFTLNLELNMQQRGSKKKCRSSFSRTCVESSTKTCVEAPNRNWNVDSELEKQMHQNPEPKISQKPRPLDPCKAGYPKT